MRISLSTNGYVMNASKATHSPQRLATLSFSRAKNRHILTYLLTVCLLSLLLAACDSGTGKQGSPQQTMKTDSGDTISYSTQPQDVLIRIFFGGGKVGSLQLTPEVSIYGNGTFITGPGLQTREGSLS